MKLQVKLWGLKNHTDSYVIIPIHMGSIDFKASTEDYDHNDFSRGNCRLHVRLPDDKDYSYLADIINKEYHMKANYDKGLKKGKQELIIYHMPGMRGWRDPMQFQISN